MLGYAIIAKDAFEQITQGDLLGLGSGAGRERTQMPVDAQQAEQFPVYPEQSGIVFENPGVQNFLGGGWSVPEGHFRWTDSLKSEVLFALNNVRAETLELRMRPFVFPGRLEAQRLRVILNGQPVASLSMSDSTPKVYEARLPVGVLQKNNVLRLEVPDAESPKNLGISNDARRLGVALEWVRLR